MPCVECELEAFQQGARRGRSARPSIRPAPQVISEQVAYLVTEALNYTRPFGFFLGGRQLGPIIPGWNGTGWRAQSFAKP